MTVTDGALVAGAIRAHNTDTSDDTLDVDEARRRLPGEEAALREAHAWAGDGSPDAKTNYRLLHHHVAEDGTVGAASLPACLNGIHALNRADSAIPDADRQAVYDHLKNHLTSAGRPEGTIPPLKDRSGDGKTPTGRPVTAAADDADDADDGGGELETADSGAPMQDTSGQPYRRWQGLAVLEGVWTGDDRFIEPEALTWREFPLPLMVQMETADGHDGARVAGRIDAAERVDASDMIDARTGRPYGDNVFAIMMSGVLDNDDMARDTEAKIKGGFLRGVSVDLSDVEYVDELVDEDGNPVDLDDEDIDLSKVRLRTRVTAGRIMGVTVTPFPAFEGAYLELVDDDGNTGPRTEPGRPTAEQQAKAIRASTDTAGPRRCLPCETGQLTAAAAPVLPPKAWFDDPKLDGPTPLTVTDDGRVYGHLALWGTCHTGITGRCVTPPRSNTGYALFRTGAIKTAEGDMVPVGKLTVGTGHAPTSRDTGAMAALAHYDNTGTAVADVAAGEDEHGIWVAGALRPEVTPEQIRVLRASPLSGDWRAWGGNLELIAALAVNTPGFPVLRQIAAGGAPLALVAAGPAPKTARAELEEIRRLLPVLTAAAAREEAARRREAEQVRARMRAAEAAVLRARVGL